MCGGRAHCASPRPRKLPGLVGRSPVEPTSTRDASGTSLSSEVATFGNSLHGHHFFWNPQWTRYLTRYYRIHWTVTTAYDRVFDSASMPVEANISSERGLVILFHRAGHRDAENIFLRKDRI